MTLSQQIKLHAKLAACAASYCAIGTVAYALTVLARRSVQLPYTGPIVGLIYRVRREVLWQLQLCTFRMWGAMIQSGYVTPFTLEPRDADSDLQEDR